MLKIRLTRRGKKNSAFFRMVVTEHTAPIKGKFIEVLGFINPKTKERDFKTDRVKYWIEKGAQCSDSAHNLLIKAGIIKGSKRAIKIKKKPVPAQDASKNEAGGGVKKEDVPAEKKETASEQTSVEPAKAEEEIKKDSGEVPAETKPEEKSEKTEEK
ncbi:MAG: 30S ribosomal protein S16 [Parcubacteria group bacterium]|jgi:small subunit ribosomal protein S16